MHITALIFILFTSFTGIVTAMDPASEEDVHPKGSALSSSLEGKVETLGSFKALVIPIIEDLEKENRRLKQLLVQKSSMFPEAPCFVSNIASGGQKPQEFFLDPDSLHSSDQETGVAFVRRVFAHLKERLLSVITELEQENLGMKYQLAEYNIPFASPRVGLSIKIDTDNFDVPYNLRLPLVPNDDREKERTIVFFEDEEYWIYDVSGFNRNCAFNVTDIPRETVILKLKAPEHLSKETKYLKGDSSIDPRFLPHIGYQLLKANVRVLTGTLESGIIADLEDEREYLSVEQKGWPTFYVLNNGKAHFQILVPLNNDTLANRLFRRYARKKEDLRLEGINGLDSPTQVHIEPAMDEVTFLSHIQIALHASHQDEVIYAQLMALQFLNGGRGGWLQSYVAWVKSLEGK